MPELSVDHTYNGKTVALQVGDVLVVTLPVNMLTGLRWIVASYDQSIIALSGERVLPPQPGGAMGAGGTVAVFRFLAEAPGLARLILELRVGNEPDEEVQKYRLQLEIE